MTTEETDNEVIERYKKGDREAFAELYDRYIRKIYNFIYYKTHHKETAEDLTSKTFMKALNALERFHGGQGTFQAWLFRIARNTVIDHYRTKRQQTDVNDVWDLSEKTDIERDTETKQLLEEVEEHMQKLPQRQRDVLILRVWEQLGYREIAEILDISEAGCRMALSRAVHTLREEAGSAIVLLLLCIVVS